jgi:hypothetical protein
MRQFDHFVEYVSGLDLESCDNHLRLQCALIDLNHIDFVGRFEQFDQDYQIVCQRLDIEITDMSAYNVSAHRGHYKTFYTDELIEKVRQMYRKDIQIFGYEY